MNLDAATCRVLLGESRSLRLATCGASGPHLVPIVFAMSDDATIVSMVDHKPKRSTDLMRLRNIAFDPRVALLADHYGDDWETLWWVRADAVARIAEDPAEIAAARRLLADRYTQYRENPPEGPLVVCTITRLVGWASTDAAVTGATGR